MFDDEVKIKITNIKEEHGLYEDEFMRRQAFVLFCVNIACAVYSLIAYVFFSEYFCNDVSHGHFEYMYLFYVSDFQLIWTLFGLINKKIFHNPKVRNKYFELLSFFSAIVYVSWGHVCLHMSIIESRPANFIVAATIFALCAMLMTYRPHQFALIVVAVFAGDIIVLNMDKQYNPQLNELANAVIFFIILSVMYIAKYISGLKAFISKRIAENTIESYNEKLELEVEEKTKRIDHINDRLILAMADMVESRDANTGGHIKRSSKGVEILVDELKKSGDPTYTDRYCAALVKAAPMHDLGKITVDDAILRKPGKYTEDEYESMKTHSAKGTEIIDHILEDTDDEYFRSVAENMSHYHHERYDGSGYPDGLKGEDIPLEARIMAVADVYDALVSQRCYKQKYSFEASYNIIMDGMGTQFDPSLEPAFRSCVDELEGYYNNDEKVEEDVIRSLL